MSRYKGQMVLFFILVGAVGIVMLLTVTGVVHANYALEVKKTLYVSLEMEDKGTEIISIMNSETTGIKYLEVMGDLSADNHEFFIDDHKEALKGTLLKVKKGGYNFYLVWPGGEEMLKAGDLDCGTVVDTDVILLWPVPDSVTISSPYKENRDDHLHGGIDIPGNGLGVVAAADGEVVLSGWENPDDYSQGFGQRITIRHRLSGEKYFYTIYGHLSDIMVDVGDKVTRGQVIGRTGSTGVSTGPHLHFELADGPLMGRNSINVCPYLGMPDDCSTEDAPPVSVSIYGTEIPIPGAQPGMLKADVDFLC